MYDLEDEVILETFIKVEVLLNYKSDVVKKI